MKKTIILLFLLISYANTAVFAESSVAPDFNLPTRSSSITLPELKGKVVYLDFWASWCHPCKQSFPWLNELQAKYKDQGLVVLGINLDKDRSQADAFLKHTPANFTIAFDPEADTASVFKVKGMPSSFLMDRNGLIQAEHKGFRDKDKAKMEQAVAQLLNNN